ncbi:hypothetical protein Tco_0304818 [Tanacetum coccineum]
MGKNHRANVHAFKYWSDALGYDLKSKFLEVAKYVAENKYKLRERAPLSWTSPTLPNCKFCNQENCMKPVMAKKKKEINWLFLLLGQMLGKCRKKLAYLGRDTGCVDVMIILSYLDLSPLRWSVSSLLIRAQLQLDDANGIFDMQIDDILAGMGAIGYPTDRTLTFLKHHLSPQWRFLVHTIMHCLSPKAGSWNQFPSSIATALICLSTGRVYNFSRFILEGMIANVKTKKNKFLMYPRFLQMLVAIETADRTPRPTFGFTRKLFSNMKFKWEGEPMPLTPPMLAIAAAGDAADEDNAAAHAAAGSTAEAHPEPHSPPVSPVREPTPERQPETEWVVPNPVSPLTDWRPWPSVPTHSPTRGPTPEPASPPTPPAQTFIFEEPLVFGPEPRPAGYVDPDVLEPIIFGPQPRPSDFVDPDLEEPVIFGPPPRPDNYIEPADIDNLVSMEDDTIQGGFHEEPL